MKRTFSKLVLSASLTLVPFVSYAFGMGVGVYGGGAYGSGPMPVGQGGTLAGLIWEIIGYGNLALLFLMAVAVVVFVYYVIRYFIISTENRKEAGPYVMYSVIGFFVILSFWGLVNILLNTFGFQNGYQPQTWQSLQSIFPQ